jgi:hypothetical protein
VTHLLIRLIFLSPLFCCAVLQTAVWGLAGMLKRNVVESSSLCWQLLLQLSQVYMAQQQQQQQQQQQTKQKKQKQQQR